MTEQVLSHKGRPKVTAWQKQRAVETIKAMSPNGIAPSRADWMAKTGCFEAWLTRACGVTSWLEALGALGLKSKRAISAHYRTGSGRKSSGKPCFQDPSHPSPLEGDKFCEAICHKGWESVGLVNCARVGNNRRG